MSTMTVIERLPGDWDYGSDWAGSAATERDCARASANVATLFDEYLSAQYGPNLYRVGQEIHGPATLLFGPETTGGQGRKYQRDTPAIDGLPNLPESIWREFCLLMEDRVDLLLDLRLRRPWKARAA